MVKQVLLNQYEFYGILMGWVFSVVLGLLVFAFIKLTPAKVFLKAWFKKCSVAWVKFRTGIGEFKLGKDGGPGVMDVDNLGPVMQGENSQVIEKNSKTAVYDVFGEYGFTIPREYPAILQELKEMGLKINDFKDYDSMIKLVNDDKFEAKYLESLEGKELEKAKKKIAELKKLEIQIKPLKSYKVHELAYMFPYNTNPVYIDSKITNEVNRREKKNKLQHQLLLYGGMAVLLVLIGVMILLKSGAFGNPDCPACVCQTMQTGVETAKAIAGNITM